MTRYLVLDLLSEPSAHRRLIEEMKELFACNAVPASLVPVFAVVIEEVLTNIVEYGLPKGSTSPIRASLLIEAGEVRGEVSDAGTPFDPLMVPDPDTTLGLEERGSGGLGILLIKQLMDRVSYERLDGRNVLRFAKTIPGTAA